MDSLQSSFSGKVILIAGGTGGLGRAITLLALKQGARVVVPYRREEEYAGLAQATGDARDRLAGFSVDVTDSTAAAKLVQDILTRFRRLDGLVNAVGAYVGGLALWETGAETFDRMIDLNLRSAYVLARGVVPVLLACKEGSIVNVSAKAAWDHAAGASAYAASKAAAIALMDSLAADLRGTGVRVNSILPSIIDTPANRQAMPNANFAKWPKPEDIARVVLFLLSDEARVIHGASIPVFGNA
ncbi:MAG TPA: SDR family NAD(P)-dependent oxidoreductase [Acidobacteriaceae bacterium]|nr:SDR family NAD(P)-dependent oxidoreductase [Acidobacteriaceae bacterium]